MTEDIINVTHEQATELWFLSMYNPEYRYFKQRLLENEFDNLNKIIIGLDEDQYEYLRLMIEIEMIVNSVQYCNELGATAICVKKNRLGELGHMLANMADRDINDFYNNIHRATQENIWGYMGYDNLVIEDSEKSIYVESCKRYKDMVCKVSKLYKLYYYFYLSYKHNLRIIPFKNNAEDTVIAAPLDTRTGQPHHCRMLSCDCMAIQKGTIEITDIIYQIYTRLYIPLIRKTFLDLIYVSTEEYARTGFSKIIESEGSEPIKPESSQQFTASINHPWWTNDGTEPKPFL